MAIINVVRPWSDFLRLQHAVENGTVGTIYVNGVAQSAVLGAETTDLSGASFLSTDGRYSFGVNQSSTNFTKAMGFVSQEISSNSNLDKAYPGIDANGGLQWNPKILEIVGLTLKKDASGGWTNIIESAEVNVAQALLNQSITSDIWNDSSNILIGQDVRNFASKLIELFAPRNPSDTTTGVGQPFTPTAEQFAAAKEYADYAGSFSAQSNYYLIYHTDTARWSRIQNEVFEKQITVDYSSPTSVWGAAEGTSKSGKFSQSSFAEISQVIGQYAAKAFFEALLAAKDSANYTYTTDIPGGSDEQTTFVYHLETDSYSIDKDPSNAGASFPTIFDVGVAAYGYDTSNWKDEYVNNNGHFIVNGSDTGPAFPTINYLVETKLNVTEGAVQNDGNAINVSDYDVTYAITANKSITLTGNDDYYLHSGTATTSTDSQSSVIITNGGYGVAANNSQTVAVGTKIDISALDISGATVAAKFATISSKLFYVWYDSSADHKVTTNTVKAITDSNIPANQNLMLYYVKDATSLSDATQKIINGATSSFGFRVSVSNKDVLGTVDSDDFILQSSAPVDSAVATTTIDASGASGNFNVEIDSSVAIFKMGSGNSLVTDSNTTSTKFVVNSNISEKSIIDIEQFDLGSKSDKLDLSTFGTVTNLRLQNTKTFDNKVSLGSAQDQFYDRYSWATQVLFDSNRRTYKIDIGVTTDQLLTISDFEEALTAATLLPVNSAPTITTPITNLDFNESNFDSSITNTVVADLKTFFNASDAENDDISFKLVDGNGNKVDSITLADKGIITIVKNDNGSYSLNFQATDTDKDFYGSVPGLQIAVLDSHGAFITTNLSFNVIGDNDDKPVIDTSSISTSAASEIYFNNNSTPNDSSDDSLVIKTSQTTQNLIIGKVQDFDFKYDVASHDYSTGFAVKVYDQNDVLISNFSDKGTFQITADGTIKLNLNSAYYNASIFNFKFSVVDNTGLESSKLNTNLTVSKVSDNITFAVDNIATTTAYAEDTGAIATTGLKIGTINNSSANGFDSGDPILKDFAGLTNVTYNATSKKWISDQGEIFLTKVSNVNNKYDVYFKAAADYNSASLSNGTLNISFKIEYQSASTSTQTVPLKITAVNDIPTLDGISTLPDVATNEDKSTTIDVLKYFKDIEDKNANGTIDRSKNNKLEIISATVGTTSYASAFSIDNNKNIKFDATKFPNYNGSIVLKVKFTDSEGGSSGEKSFNFNIAVVSDVPVITPISTNHHYKYGDSVSLTLSVQDLDGKITSDADALNKITLSESVATSKFKISNITSTTNENGIGKIFTVTIIPKASINEFLQDTLTLKVNDGTNPEQKLDYKITIATDAFNNVEKEIGSYKSPYKDVASVTLNPINAAASVDISKKSDIYIDTSTTSGSSITVQDNPVSDLKWTTNDNAMLYNPYSKETIKLTDSDNYKKILVPYIKGNDSTLILTSGNDLLALEDNINGSITKDNTPLARFEGIKTINAGDGNDAIDLSSDKFKLTSGITINGGNGNDILWGNDGADILNGDTGNDKINGGAGNDIITGGLGKDTLTGGLGSDIFKFGSLADSSISASATDLITDFEHGSDKIDLSAINLNATGQDSIANLTISTSNGFTTIQGKDGNTDFKIDLKGSIALDSGDFAFHN